MQHCLLNINVFGYKQRTAALCWICSWRSGFAFTEIFFSFRSVERVLCISCCCRMVWLAENGLTQKVNLWSCIVAGYMSVMLSLNRRIVRVGFQCLTL